VRINPKAKESNPLGPDRGPVVSPRFVIALVLMAAGIAWIAYYYTAVRADPTVLGSEGGGPGFMQDLGKWNYLIGFGALFVGLMVSAHPTTPLGRNRGVVVAMLSCFLIGLIWICVYYLISDDPADVPVFNDLGQKNLFVGIGFMAVGFSFATRWE
jgi:hypothetical protein